MSRALSYSELLAMDPDAQPTPIKGTEVTLRVIVSFEGMPSQDKAIIAVLESLVNRIEALTEAQGATVNIPAPIMQVNVPAAVINTPPMEKTIERDASGEIIKITERPLTE